MKNNEKKKINLAASAQGPHESPAEPPPCKICAGATRTIYDRQFQRNFYHCATCDFLFRDDALILNPEEEEADYLTHHNTLENEGYVNMFRDFLGKAALPYLAPRHKNAPIPRALDFGCGPGPDWVLAHVMREELKFETDVYDIFFSPEKVYLDKTYDLITCTEVIEHLRNPMETLELLKSLLNPQGILAVSTLFHPISEENPGGEEIFQDWWYRREFSHISFFRPRTIRYIAKKMDMELLMIDERNTLSLRRGG